MLLFSPRWFSIMVLATVTASPAVAANFRIETKIYVGSESSPAAENLTLFTDEGVYDFMMTEPQQIAIYDEETSELSIIDPQRRIQTRVTTDQLLRVTAKLKARIAELDAPDQPELVRLLQFAADPRFSVNFDSQDRIITMKSDEMTYRARGIQPLNDEAARQYYQFSDWYARLNATLPGTLPPFARLALNRELADRRLVPDQVRLDIPLFDEMGNRPGRIRSEHKINWGPLMVDRRRVDMARSMRELLPVVSFDEYRSAKTAARDE